MAALEQEVDQQLALDAISAEQTPSEKLLAACEQGDLKAAQEALIGGANIETTNQQRDTALILAARQGHAGIVRWLLGSGANVNAVGYQDRTALMQAVVNGRSEVVELLLRQLKIDVAKQDQDFYTALTLALENTGSIKDINSKIVNMLIRAGTEIDQCCGRSDAYTTALLKAWGKGDKEAAEYIIALGADIEFSEKLFRSSSYPDQWPKEMGERIALSKVYRKDYCQVARTSGQAVATKELPEDMAREIGKTLFGRLGLNEFQVGYRLHMNRLEVERVAWQKWNKEYSEKFPDREKNGYGPGALVIK